MGQVNVNDSSGHKFKESYLDGQQSGPKILKDVLCAIDQVLGKPCDDKIPEIVINFDGIVTKNELVQSVSVSPVDTINLAVQDGHTLAVGLPGIENAASIEGTSHFSDFVFRSMTLGIMGGIQGFPCESDEVALLNSFMKEADYADFQYEPINRNNGSLTGMAQGELSYSCQKGSDLRGVDVPVSVEFKNVPLYIYSLPL